MHPSAFTSKTRSHAIHTPDARWTKSSSILLAFVLSLALLFPTNSTAQPMHGASAQSTLQESATSGLTWHKLDVATPSARANHAMAFDPSRQQTVLFGGSATENSSCVVKGDTWVWDGRAWREQKTSAGPAPSARAGHAMAYHPGKKMVLLFGGSSQCGAAGGDLADTWGWDGEKWINLTASNETITPRSGHILAWLESKERMVMFGGFKGNTAYKGTWYWQDRWLAYNLPTDSLIPTVGKFPAGASSDGEIVLAGDRKSFYFDGTKWHAHGASIVPPMFASSAMVHLPKESLFLDYGGLTSTDVSSITDASWVRKNAISWVAQSYPNTPSARAGHAMAYDSLRHEAQLFGGHSATGESDEFWVLRGPDTRYVSHSGNDAGNDCTQSAQPCKTINYALEKAAPGSEIRIRGGDYTFQNQGAKGREEVVLIEKDVKISGGYNSGFRKQSQQSWIVGEVGATEAEWARAISVRKGAKAHLHRVSARSGIAETGGTIYIDGELILRNATVKEGQATLAGGCIFSAPNSRLELNEVLVRNCTAQRAGGGIFSNSALEMNDAIVINNNAFSSANDTEGGGIGQFNGPLDLKNTTITHNHASKGGGLHISYTQDSNRAVLWNVAILLNGADKGGGLYMASGKIAATNVTIARNEARDAGGGIFRDQKSEINGSLRLNHTLLAANGAGKTGQDCAGVLESADYNLIGSNHGCTFSSTTSDIVGTFGKPINPWLDATGAPLPGSPAIDAGNTQGCLATDRRNVKRGSYLPCDIGAYETTKTTKTKPQLPQLPMGTRYVSSLGDDANDCLTPQTACATLPHTMATTPYYGTIAVSGHTFKPGDSETWYVDKPVRFSGGWDDAFSQQTGWTTIDGEGVNPAVSVTWTGLAAFEGFVFQNGQNYRGGGVYNEGGVSLLRSMVVDNGAVEGGGIFNMGDLQLAHTLVARNRASDKGGALFQLDGVAELNHMTMTANRLAAPGASAQQVGPTAQGTAGIAKDLGEIHVYNSILATNPTSDQDGTCGDSNPFDTLQYSLYSDPGCTLPGENGNLLADPLFMAADRGDYHLSPSSPAIDSAQPGQKPSIDIDGDLRPCHGPGNRGQRADMGFDEYSTGYVCYGSTLHIFLPVISASGSE